MSKIEKTILRAVEAAIEEMDIYDIVEECIREAVEAATKDIINSKDIKVTADKAWESAINELKSGYS